MPLTKKVQSKENDIKYGKAIHVPHSEASSGPGVSLSGTMQPGGSPGLSIVLFDKAIIISCQASPADMQKSL